MKMKDFITVDQRCADVFGHFNASQMLCIGGTEEGGKSACNGDSGNAFQCRATDGLFYEVGIVSFGKPPCALPNIPDVFTKVSSFIDWIQKTINDNSI